ncbi:MAG TPA: hypothetical protein VH249_26060 [Xanthobacteraceae bacterium]|jgi:hypothetical protein|nr:hypothetical protein [Xanthobacteraceae bacterium]
MLASVMYFGTGFLLAALMGLAIFLRVRGRALRLATRRPEAATPPSFAEVRIDKDPPRAEFAMPTRRPETTVEQRENRDASQLAELRRNGDARGPLALELNAPRAEITPLEIAVEVLRARLTAAGKGGNAERGVIPPAPAQWPTALVKVPVETSRSPPLIDQRHEGDVVSLVPEQWRIVETAGPDGPVRDPHAGRSSSGHGIGSARDFSAGTREPRINVLPRPCGVENDESASEGPSIGGRVLRTFVRRCVVVLIGGGVTFAWQYHGDDLKKMARSWALWPGGLSSVSSVPTTSPPAPASVGAATSPELVQQPAVAQDLAGIRPGVDQPATTQAQPPAAQQQAAVTQEPRAAKQDHVARHVATPQAVAPDVTPKTSSVPRQPRAKLTPSPETRPTTIAGWMVRDVNNGTAVLEGPGGVRRAAQGDTVPGVGRIESIVRWGNRWLVATSSGLISTP